MIETLSQFNRLIPALALVCAATVSSAYPQKGMGPTITHIELARFGWYQPPKMHLGEMDLRSSHPVAIDHKGRVLVGFTVRTELKGLATGDHPAFSFLVLRFGVGERPDLSLALPTNNLHDNGVYLDGDDNIIVRADDRLQLLTDSEKGPNAIRWQDLADCGPRCDIAQSFSRGTLVLLNLDSDPPVSILQGAPPHVVKRCQQTQSGFDRYSPRFTNAFAYSVTGGAWPAPLPVIYRWPLCDYEDKVQMEVPSGEFRAIFPLNDQLAVVSGSKRVEQKKKSVRMISVISTEGSVKFSVQLPKHDQPENWVQGSESGNRFAISIATWRGGSRLLDTNGKRVARRVAVYNAATGKELADIQVTPYALIDLAMSPDGHRVAVLANGTLTIADIP